MLRNFSHIIHSLFFFLSGVIKKRRYDVVFYYPQHFNRGKYNENQFFKQLLLSCDNNNISYIIFEEPDFTIRNQRNNKVVPFDFLYLLIIFLRKLYGSKLTGLVKDQKIGSLIAKVFFKRFIFNHYITLSQSMLSIFKGINPNAKLYDLQHGIIHNNKKNYLVNGVAESNLLANNVNLLLSGESYKDLLVTNDKSNYFQSHIFVIGSHVFSSEFIHQKFNDNVLITLQFTHDHSDKQNTILLNELKLFVYSVDTKVNFYLKHHPRFNNEVDLSEILELPNTHFAPDDINECFKLCSLHATTYSTSAFEASLSGIPTILIHSQNELNFFKTDFMYPLNHNISDFKDITVYQKSAEIVKIWAKEYYSPYNESIFLNLLK